MTAFFNFVKPRRDNKEKRLKCTENIAFLNCNHPLRPVYTEHDHERKRGVRTELRISNLYESVYTKGDHERGWKLVRAESRRINSGANFYATAARTISCEPISSFVFMELSPGFTRQA